MAQKHIHVLLPHYTQPDHDVEEIGGSVVGDLYTTGKAKFRQSAGRSGPGDEIEQSSASEPTSAFASILVSATQLFPAYC